MGWLKDMVRSWLEIVPADPRAITIYEPMGLEAEIVRNKIWYRGNAYELEQFYKQMDMGYGDSSRFWAAVPDTEQLRKIHSGLPAMIVDTLAYLVAADMGQVDFGDDSDAIKTTWEEIAKAINFDELIGQALRVVLSQGDGCFKISIDTDVSPYPIVEFYEADRVTFLSRHGYVYGVDFWTDIRKDKEQYRLRERYCKEQDEQGNKYSVITYTLFEKEKEVPLERVPELADLKPAAIPGNYLPAVPLIIYKNPRFQGRGKAIYDSKTGVFDAFDETISQWIDAVRAGRVQRYIPDDLIPRNPDNGSLRAVNAFGSNMIRIETDEQNQEIKTVQPEIRYEAYLSTYTAMLDMCLQGIISPATLGIDVGKMASGEAQREKKDVTGYTRNTITAVLEKVLPTLIAAILMTYDNMLGQTPGRYEPSISFGEYGAPDFNSRIDTIGKAATAMIMSIESQVEELWGGSKDKEWIAEEIKRVKQLKGIEEMPEPSVGDDLIDMG